MSDRELLIAGGAALVVLVILGRRLGSAAGDALDSAQLSTTDLMARLSGLEAHQRRLLTDPRFAEIEAANIRAWRWPWEL